MKDTGVIRVVAQGVHPEVKEWSPEVEEQWNKYYDEYHMTVAIKSGVLNKVTRYKLIQAPEQEDRNSEETNYAKYLSIYEFEAKEGMEAYDNSKQHRDNLRQYYSVHRWKNKGIINKWLVEYELMQKWEKPEVKETGVIRVVAQGVHPEVKEWSPEVEEQWNKYYDEYHMTSAIKSGVLNKVTRYKLMQAPEQEDRNSEETNYAKYLSIYEFETKESMEAYDNSKQHRDNLRQYYSVHRWKNKGIVNKWLVEYELMQKWEK